MSVMGEAWLIPQSALLKLAEIAALSKDQAKQIIDQHCHVASQFSRLANTHFAGVIKPRALYHIQKKLDENSKAARA